MEKAPGNLAPLICNIGTKNMKIFIALFLAVTVIGCSQQPLAPTQSHSERKPSGMTEDQVKKIAADFKAEWLKENPSETELMGPATVSEVKPTATGWHVIFERVTLPGKPEGESHHFLHVYINSKGRLEKIVRGPDEIT